VQSFATSCVPRSFTGDPATEVKGDGEFPKTDHHLSKLRFQYTSTSVAVCPTLLPSSLVTGRGPDTVTVEPGGPDAGLSPVL
jgi:hypothetical protein